MFGKVNNGVTFYFIRYNASTTQGSDHSMKKSRVFLIILTLLVIVGVSLIYFGRFEPVNLPINVMIPVNTTQDVYAYLDDQVNLHEPLLSEADQQRYRQQFLARYFYPWSDTLSLGKFCITADDQNCYSILTMQQEVIEQWRGKSGYDEYYSDRDSDWLEQWVDNMDLVSFPNAVQANWPLTGIVIHNSALRQMPGEGPGYARIEQPGEGYPFDYLQQSAIWLGTPIQIIHYAKDQQWLLVEAAGLIGWIKRDDVAYVDETFIKTWRQADEWLTLTKHKTTLTLDDSAHKPFTLYLGTLLPVQGSHVLLPVCGSDRFAKVMRVMPNPHVLQRWPLAPTPAQFANLINDLLGMPYGWGGIGFNDDCSGTLRNLWAAFALWLPRNSYSQAHLIGKIYPLPIDDYSPAVRQQLLQSSLRVPAHNRPSLIPFLTLISFGNTPQSINHIGLYVGHSKVNDMIIFQNIWGLNLVDRRRERSLGRAIIGRAVLSTLDAGKGIQVGGAHVRLVSQWEKPGLNVTVLE